jgi:hypothetical protein
MRQLHKLGDCHRSLRRSSFTEAQFLKFAKPRAEDKLTNRIVHVPNSPDTTNDAITIAEPTLQFAAANGSMR